MKELPLNRQPQGLQSCDQRWERPGTTNAETATVATPELEGTTREEHPPAPHPELNADRPLWAVSRARGKAIIHRVKEAAWNIPLNEWKTSCGWQFARHNVKVELTKRPPEVAALCAKCNKIEVMRDDVRRAREWAHEIQMK